MAFQKIDKRYSKTERTEKMLRLMKRKYDLKQTRLEQQVKVKEFRKLIYKLSIKINELEGQLDTYLLEMMEQQDE